MRKFLLPIIAIIILSACGSDPYVPRDPNPGKPTEPSEPDYSEIIASATLRAELPGKSINYGNPGVMYTEENGSSSFIDLDRGMRIDFNPGIPSLSLDGQPIDITSHAVIHSQGETIWHFLHITYNYADTTAVIVTEKLIF